MNHSFSELAGYLNAHQQTIIDRWIETCENDEALGVVGRLTRKEFRDNIPAALQGLCRFLRRGADPADSEQLGHEIGTHGHHRWKQGFSLKELIRDWGNMNRVLVAVVESFFEQSPPSQPAIRAQAMDRLAEFMTEAMGHSVRRFDDLRRAEAAALARDLKFAREKFDELTQTRGQMLREAAHDIRGGLTAIAGASAVLKVSQDPNESFTEVLDALDGGVESVKEMLNSLLDLSRLEAGADRVALLSVDIADVLKKLVTEYWGVASEKGLRLGTEGPDEMFVQTDPQKVRRIAQNLLVNALEHTSQGEVCLAWKQEESRWLLYVRDTGPGIQDVLGSPMAQELNDPNDDPHDYEAHDSHAYAGEGIGLTIVKRLCDLLDAGVSLESAWGQGTTFTVEFPVHYPA